MSAFEDDIANDESGGNPSSAARPKRPQQQVELFSMLKRTFHRSWYDWYRESISSRLLTPVIMLCFVFMTWLLLVIAYAIGAMLSETVAQIAMWLTVAVLSIPLFSTKREVESTSIRQSYDRIHLGLIGEAFEKNRLEPALLGCLIGAQWALVGTGKWHMGMPVEAMKEGKAFGYAFDNFTHAVFGDLFELYGWNTMPPFQHTFWSATTFCLFRTAASVLALLWLRMIWQRFLARRLIRHFPANCTYRQMIDWLRSLSRTEGSWMLRNFDEFLFLRIAAEYLDGDFAAVRRLSGEFPRLRVADDLRQLFVDADGNQLFEGYRLEEA